MVARATPDRSARRRPELSSLVDTCPQLWTPRSALSSTQGDAFQTGRDEPGRLLGLARRDVRARPHSGASEGNRIKAEMSWSCVGRYRVQPDAAFASFAAGACQCTVGLFVCGGQGCPRGDPSCAACGAALQHCRRCVLVRAPDPRKAELAEGA